MYLGGRSLLSALRGSRLTEGNLAREVGGRLRGTTAFRQGIINNLANPKMAMFFASVFPQFAPAGSGMLAVLLALGAVFSGLTLLWLTLYAVVIARAGRVLRGSAVGRAIDGASGIALIGLGLKIAMEER